MTCKDCIHYDMCIECNGYDDFTGQPITFDDLEERSLTSKDCESFKDKSKFIELPCTVGDLIGKIVAQNAIVSVSVPDESDNHYSICIYKGMAWAMPEEVRNLQLKHIIEVIEEKVTDANVHIEAEQKLKELQGDNE